MPQLQNVAINDFKNVEQLGVVWLKGGGYEGISICCACPQNAFTKEKLFQADDLKVGQGTESFDASLQHLIGICQYTLRSITQEIEGL